MNRRFELLLVTGLLLLAALLRTWDLSRLPPGFSNQELAYIRMSETVRQGEVAVYYQVGDGQGRAGMFPVFLALVTDSTGGGLLGYRLLALWAGLSAVALLYLLARRLFGVPVALIALGLTSVNLRAILLARNVSAEALVPLFTLLVLLMLTSAFSIRQTVTFRSPRTLPFALLALLLGMGGYLHYTLLLLAPVSVLLLAHLLLTHQPLSRRVWSMSVFVIVLATIVGTPYLISTLRDPRLSEPYLFWRDRPHDVLNAVDALLHAVGGVIWRGDPSPAHNLPHQPLFGPLVALFLLGGVGVAIRRWREPRYMLLLLTLLAGVLSDAWIDTDATFSANLIALPALFILPGIGVQALASWLHGRGLPRVWPRVAAALLVVLVVDVVAVRQHLFDDFRHNAQVYAAYHADLGYLAAYLDRTPDGLPVSVCMAGMDEPQEVGLPPRQMLRLMLHRKHLHLRRSDCRGGLVLINAGAPMRLAFGDINDRDQMPPELAEWLSDAEPIPVEGLPLGSVLRVDVEQRIRDAGGWWEMFSPAFYMPDDEGRIERVDLPVQLERNLTFAGYDPRVFEGERSPGGDPIVLATYWRVDGPLPRDLGIFAHLLAYAESGSRVPLLEPWAESNRLDVIPKDLRSRDFFIQMSYLWLAPSVKPGSYALTVGAYSGTVTILDHHLDVLDAAHDYQPHGDRLLLGDFLVSPPAPPPANGPAGSGS